MQLSCSFCQRADILAVDNRRVEEPAFSLMNGVHLAELAEVFPYLAQLLGESGGGLEQRGILQIPEDFMPVTHGVGMAGLAD